MVDQGPPKMQAGKSVSQAHRSEVLRELLRRCLILTSNAAEYGKVNCIDNRKEMKDFYRSLKGVDIPSCYKVASITRACAILKSREKGERRRKPLRHRKALKPMVCITTGFFTTVTGKLFITLGHEKYAMVQLNRYTHRKISEPGTKVRSLTITNDIVSFFYSREVKSISVKRVYGVDRNEKNLTFGGQESVVQVGLSRVVRIKQTTREVVASFKRDDVRVRRELSSKYWNRANHRTEQMLHAASNYLIGAATRSHAAIALEDLTGIDRLYRRGNGRGTQYRFRMNSWPHFKVLRMLEYKSAWKGVTVIRLTKSDTRGSSSIHTCGEGLRNPAGDSVGRGRVLWCPKCKVWVDRDVNAAIVLSERGLVRLASSLPSSRARMLLAREKWPTGEAVMGNRTMPAILRVDAGKLSSNGDASKPW